MPGTQTTQTKRIKQALLKAGYTMKEISVRTPCNHRGEYQDTRISIHAKLARQERLLPAVLATNEVNVSQYIFIYTTPSHEKELRWHYIYSECFTPTSKFEVIDLVTTSLKEKEI